MSRGTLFSCDFGTIRPHNNTRRSRYRWALRTTLCWGAAEGPKRPRFGISGTVLSNITHGHVAWKMPDLDMTHRVGVSVAVAVGVAGEPGMCPAGFGGGTLRAERERDNTHFYYCTP